MADMKENSGSIISVVGKERCDIAYAIAQIASAMKKTVLIIDNSMTHDLFLVFSHGKEPDSEVIDLGQMTVCCGCEVPEEDMREFGLTVIYSGLNCATHPPADVHVLATSGEMAEVQALSAYSAYAETAEDSYILIQRDRVNRKQTLATIAAKIGIRPQKSYVLALSADDTGAYQALTLNGNSGLKGISQDMSALVSDIMADIYGIHPRKIKKYLGGAKR